MAIIQGSANRASVRGFYPKTINGSLRFNSGDAPYLSYTNTTATNGKKCTLSFWIKKNEIIGSTTTARFIQAYSGVGNQFHSQWGDGATSPGDQWQISPGEQSSQQGMRMTDASLRDPSAWYHCVWKYNSESGSEESTLYINGVQQSSSVYTTAPTTNLVTSLTKSGTEVKIGYINSSMPDFQLAELFILDGQSLGADSFGETKNGVWVPKNVTASNFTMGNNGVYLNFQDDATVEAFNTVLWRGDGGTQSITGTGFSPDLVWIKNRDNADNHYLYDTVRGANRYLNSDTTGAEAYSSNDLNSFDADGFTVGSDGGLNRSGQAIVAWQWDAGANNASTGHSSVTYTGNGGTQKISGFPFSPDLVWIKERNGARQHHLYDTVRGATKVLFSSLTNAESTNSTFLTSFDSDGFHVGSDIGVNGSGQNFVAWGWDAGDSAPVSNTNGSITSTVKASTTNGFSIVSYTGTATAGTIGHGLSSAPTFIITKPRNGTTTYGWRTYHESLGNTKYILLNSSAVPSTFGDWNNTSPTSTVFSVGSTSPQVTNESGTNYIAYCWHDVTGKQKFGSYTGDGTTDGSNAINVGFRPGFLMVKRTDSTGFWYITDGSRSPLNDVDKVLYADLSSSEDTSTSFEFTNTGFNIKTSGGSVNASGGTYIYAAFAGSYSDYITDYNTDGSIDSRVKASQTYGFSICSFNSGASGTRSFGHGLGTTPSLCIFKERNSGGAGDHWVVWEGMTGNPATSYGYLNLGNAFGTDTSQWSNTAPTSTEFTFNSGYAWSINQDMIAYCWAEKTGYSKFGSYTGNGSSSGPSVTTNFNPACLIVKRTDTTGNWFIWDNTRDTDGVFNTNIHPNLSNAEAASGSNFVTPSSTGFQLTGTGAETNASGGTYIYAAFADTREAAFWLDQSSNNNDWQPVNLDHNDTVADSPTDNYPVLLLPTGSSYLDGPRKIGQTAAVSNTYRSYVASMAISSGKWYAEVTVNDVTRNLQPVGIFEMNDAFDPQSDTTFAYYGSRTGVSAQLHQNWAVFSQNGQIHSVYNGTNQASYGSATANGDTLMIALDMDNYKVWIGNNGTWFGDGNPSTGANPTFSGASFAPTNPVCFGGSLYQNRASNHDWNFGQRPFKYSPPE